MSIQPSGGDTSAAPFWFKTPPAAFDYFTLALGNDHDSGNTYMFRTLLGILAAFFDRLGRYEPAATIAGFAVTSPVAALPAMAELGTAITHLRNVLGDQTYASLARNGEVMSTAAVVAYAVLPNRPGPSRTDRRLEIDDIRGSQNPVSNMHSDLTDIADQQ